MRLGWWSFFLAAMMLASAPLAAAAARPSLHLDGRRLDDMRSKVRDNSPDYVRLKEAVDQSIASGPATASDPEGTLLGMAALYLATGETTYRDSALAWLDWVLQNHRLGGGWPSVSANPRVPARDFRALLDFTDAVYRVALAVDWLYADLGADRLATARTFLEEYCESATEDGSWSIDAGSSWSEGALRWMTVLGSAGLSVGSGQPWNGYVTRARGVLSSWMDQLCRRFASGGGSIEGTQVGSYQVNVTRLTDLFATAAFSSEARVCKEYFSVRGDYLANLLHANQNRRGLLPFRSGDFADDGSVAGYPRLDEMLEEMLLLQRDSGSAKAAARIAFAIDRLEATPVDTAHAYAPFCFRDPTVAPASERVMPLSHFAPGTGEVLARASWETSTSPAASLFCGDHRSNRQHLDQNSVQLTGFGGDLLIDSGNADVLSDSGVDGYSARTVAHNTLLIADSAESFQDLKVVKGYPSDCGQRGFTGGDGPDLRSISTYKQNREVYATGRILRFEDAGFYAYALGDATDAYSNDVFTAPPTNPPKCRLFQREFVFLRPVSNEAGAYVVLFDRVEVPAARREALRVSSLFHFVRDPTLNGTPVRVAGSGSGGVWRYTDADLAQASDGDGRIFLRALLPASPVITKIGGRNYEQYNQGRNYPGDSLYGSWRVEIESAVRSSKTFFLSVAEAEPAGRKRATDAELIETKGDVAGVLVKSARINWVCVFIARTDGSPPAFPIQYRYVPTAAQRNLVFGLTPEAGYSIDAIDLGPTRVVTITPGGPTVATDTGTLTFGLPKRPVGADTTPPTGSLIINGGGSYTSTPAVLLMLSAQDSQSGMDPGGSIATSNDGRTWGDPQPYDTLTRHILTGGDGGKTVFVKFRDAAGNWSEPSSDTIVLATSGTPRDDTLPQARLSINDGASSTESITVTLTPGGTDLESGIGALSQMQFSNDGSSWSTAEPIARTKEWILSYGKGMKTVYARVQDQAGNWSSPTASSILYQ